MSNMRLCRLVLDDRWPGVPVSWSGYPNRTASCGSNGKGWDNTIDNFCSGDDTDRALNAGKYAVPIGQKRQVYTDNTNCMGYYTMMYLCYHSYEADGNTDISKDFSDGKFWCAPTGLLCETCSEWADTSISPHFVVSRCTTGADTTKTGRIAIPCSTHIYSEGTAAATNGYGDGYGWFWVGGVCPCKDITILDDETGDQKGVDITCQCDRGPVMLEITGNQPMPMPCDVSNMTDATGIVGALPADIAIGWTCASAA